MMRMILRVVLRYDDHGFAEDGVEGYAEGLCYMIILLGLAEV
jgi:hypothetical protein